MPLQYRWRSPLKDRFSYPEADILDRPERISGPTGRCKALTEAFCRCFGVKGLSRFQALAAEFSLEQKERRHLLSERRLGAPRNLESNCLECLPVSTHPAMPAVEEPARSAPLGGICFVNEELLDAPTRP